MTNTLLRGRDFLLARLFFSVRHDGLVLDNCAVKSVKWRMRRLDERERCHQVEGVRSWLGDWEAPSSA